ETGLLGNSNNIINNNHLSAAELSQLLDLYRERASKLEKEKITLQKNIQEKQRELNKIQAQIQEQSRGQQNRFAEVIAEVQSDTDQALTFQLTYLVRNAGWKPSYDIRGTDINAPLSLNYKAGIYQNTGVDWENVSLTVGSGNPSLNSTLPEINPHFIGFRENQVIQTKQVAYEEMAMPSYSDGVNLEAEMALNPVTRFNQNQTTFSYTIETPYSVPSNGKEYTVEFRKEELPAKYIYATIPRFSEKAYLTASINDWNEFDLIPGQASIYFDNAYVGSTSISTDSFEDSLQVSLGVDQGINVKRKKLREYSENTFFGNKVEENYTWEINLRNNKDTEISINVKDLIPISNNEDIVVEKINLSKGDINDETGIITWFVQLDPGQSKSIKFSYRLRYPKGRELSL
ncbi:MAG TPA: hypothetical protein DEG32_05905, partial [Balneolaceae bacterium]|nr:hypothetical protein [Balneolaceae bacterium]